MFTHTLCKSFSKILIWFALPCKLCKVPFCVLLLLCDWAAYGDLSNQDAEKAST